MASSAPRSPMSSEFHYTNTDSPATLLRDTSPYLQIPHHLMDMERSRSLPPRRLSPSPAARQVRRPLRQYTTIDDAVGLLKNTQKIIVLTGAGVSTSCGIPDFRSSAGLYKTLRRQRFDDPQELFELGNFLAQPSEFFEDVEPIIPRLRFPRQTKGDGKVTALDTKTMLDTIPQFGPTHAFLSLLQSKNKLLTNYTQNIDGLELAAGVDPEHLINCHGNWESATCITCGKRVPARKYLPIVYAGMLPLCSCIKKSLAPKPVSQSLSKKRSKLDLCDFAASDEKSPENRRVTRPRQQREEKKDNADFVNSDNESSLDGRKTCSSDRSSKSVKEPKKGRSGKKRRREQYEEDEDSEDDGTADLAGRPGLLKPDITFFGEGISECYMPRLETDKSQVDLLLIIGTSLKVGPVNEFPFAMPAHVPQVWISKERCQRGGLKVDIELIGECDVVVEELCRRAGWPNALRNRLWRPKMTAASQTQTKDGKMKKPEVNHDVINTNVESKEANEDNIIITKKPLTINARPALTPITALTTAANTTKTVTTPTTTSSGAVCAAGTAPTKTATKPAQGLTEVIIELEEGTDNRWFVRRATK